MSDSQRAELRERSTGWRIGAETVWLPTAQEMAALDADAVTSGATTERTLIESAGRELAGRIQAHFPEGRVVAVVGSGHNGADALVAVRTLHAWGREVDAVLAGSSPPEPDVLSGWPFEPRPLLRLDEAAFGAGVLLDGILGTGLTGAPREPQASLIARLNDLGPPIVAVDGPSGANFTTGAVEGACIRAALTVSFGWPKLGLMRHPARAYCGDLEAVEIGFPPSRDPFGARAITGRWVARMLPARPADAHKGRAGYLALIAGQEGMAGASVLAARAALRGGVGVLKVVGDPANREIVQRSVPGAIFVAWDAADEVADALRWAGALAIGPGVGRSTARAALVDAALESRGATPAVVDADGLSVWAGKVDALAERLTPTDVITPHPGELARLLERPVEAVVADPPAAAREAMDLFGCTVLLKGAPSFVATGDEPLRVSTVGGAALAAGGTGDVLTGLVGALLAAGVPAAAAAAAAMFLSGLAAEESVEPVGHVAADLPDRLPAARSRVAGLGPPDSGSLLFASYGSRARQEVAATAEG